MAKRVGFLMLAIGLFFNFCVPSYPCFLTYGNENGKNQKISKMAGKILLCFVCLFVLFSENSKLTKSQYFSGRVIFKNLISNP